MSVFNHSDIERYEQRRLSPVASMAVISGLSAALWALVLAAGMELWSIL